MLTFKYVFYLFVCVKFVTGVCEKSFFVICGSLSDVKFNKTKKSWTELLIDPNSAQEDPPKYVLTNEYLDIDLKNNLKWLIINNHLSEIKSKAFTYCKRLHHLILYGNDLREIKKDTFFAFKKLLKLGLENNNIKTLKRNSFSGSTVDTVDISFNKIQFLNSGVFDRKCSVDVLRITHNELFKIEINSLPKNLKYLHLDHNKFQILPDELTNLQELQELTISHNVLETVTTLTELRQINKLDLSFNSISSISDEFDNMANLNWLNLSANRLRRVSFTLKFIKNVEDVGEMFTLLLAHNLLRNLDLQQIRNVDVTLSGNPWNCECMKKMERTMKNNSIIKTICDQEIFSSGYHPYCIVDKNDDCNDYSVPNEVLEKFQKSFTDTYCDVFNDIESHIS